MNMLAIEFMISGTLTWWQANQNLFQILVFWFIFLTKHVVLFSIYDMFDALIEWYGNYHYIHDDRLIGWDRCLTLSLSVT